MGGFEGTGFGWYTLCCSPYIKNKQDSLYIFLLCLNSTLDYTVSEGHNPERPSSLLMLLVNTNKLAINTHRLNDQLPRNRLVITKCYRANVVRTLFNLSEFIEFTRYKTLKGYLGVRILNMR